MHGPPRCRFPPHPPALGEHILRGGLEDLGYCAGRTLAIDGLAVLAIAVGLAMVLGAAAELAHRAVERRRR